MESSVFNTGYGSQSNRGSPRNLKEKAYIHLKEKIIKCEYPPGMALSERDLMETLGVSRTPIREAINLLEQENLIKIYPRRGMFVENITVKDIQDIFTVRKTVEPLVTKLATPHIKTCGSRPKQISIWKMTARFIQPLPDIVITPILDRSWLTFMT